MKTYNYWVTDPYSRIRLGDEAERLANLWKPEAGIDYCYACGEDTAELIDGYCPDCIWQLFHNHAEEITEWNAKDSDYDPDLDLSMEGAEKFCLEDDPEYFIRWVMKEHPTWLWEIEVI